jgi:hypothetical protein
VLVFGCARPTFHVFFQRKLDNIRPSGIGAVSSAYR